MVKRTGPSNENLILLIRELKKLGNKEKVNLWRVVAKELSKPSRMRRQVNIKKIDLYCRDNEIALVPGKVLSDGDLNKKVKVAGFKFSEKAKTKLKDSMSIQDLMKSNPKGKNVRLIC